MDKKWTKSTRIRTRLVLIFEELDKSRTQLVLKKVRNYVLKLSIHTNLWLD